MAVPPPGAVKPNSANRALIRVSFEPAIRLARRTRGRPSDRPSKEDIMNTMSGISEIRELSLDELGAVAGGDCYNNHSLSYNGVTLLWGQCDNAGAQFG